MKKLFQGLKLDHTAKSVHEVEILKCTYLIAERVKKRQTWGAWATGREEVKTGVRSQVKGERD